MKQLDLFPEELRLVSIDPERNRRSYYALSVHRDLFGTWRLQREWGRIGRPGRMRLEVHASVGAALDALESLGRAKLRRGYRLD